MTQEYAIEINNVVKIFGESTVLDHMNCKIHHGKVTTLLGFSGAGKTTLLRHILGLIKPTSGEVIVFGQDLAKLSDLELREFRKNFGMVFQYSALFDFLTAYENIAFPMREFTTWPESEIKERIFSLLDAAGLAPDSAFKLPSELSGGMRKRVGLARALALEPKIMLYDEPTSGLDPITTHMVNDLIIKTSERNKARQMTSVIISHDIQGTLKISDYIAFLEKGRVVEHLDTESFKKSTNPVIRRFLEL